MGRSYWKPSPQKSRNLTPKKDWEHLPEMQCDVRDRTLCQNSQVSLAQSVQAHPGGWRRIQACAERNHYSLPDPWVPFLSSLLNNTSVQDPYQRQSPNYMDGQVKNILVSLPQKPPAHSLFRATHWRNRPRPSFAQNVPMLRWWSCSGPTLWSWVRNSFQSTSQDGSCINSTSAQSGSLLQFFCHPSHLPLPWPLMLG